MIQDHNNNNKKKGILKVNDKVNTIFIKQAVLEAH